MNGNPKRELQPRRAERPEQEFVRGVCPQCREALISDVHYVDGRGYIVTWKCWAEDCDYLRVL